MRGNKKNALLVIERGIPTVYDLDEKLRWEVGRLSKDNIPDIPLCSRTISRQHGYFKNIDGCWFYVDNNKKNGTVYNGKHITGGLKGRVRPISLKDRDVLVFGGGETPVVSQKTAWAIFTEYDFGGSCQIENTANLECFSVSDGNSCIKLEHPAKGTVLDLDAGLAVYLGDATYLLGNIQLMK